ncbi:MAG: hypothetical protein Q4F67_14925, partial [Propionibacteriaceae bacterium]|nr:hypothetical protein [Propionibacteriaceae bacterium]
MGDSAMGVGGSEFFGRVRPKPGPALEQVPNLEAVRAEALGEQLQGLTAAKTQLDHRFLLALAEFDQCRAWRWFTGIGSTA